MQIYGNQIPKYADETRYPNDRFIARTSYKAICRVAGTEHGESVYYIRYYNTGTHWRTWDVAREKYNSLKSLSATELNDEQA